MKEELELRENVVLKWDDKSFQDTMQLIDGNSEDKLNNLITSLKTDPEKDRVSGIYLQKGKKYWLEIEVEDSFMSSSLFEWLYGKSNFDESRLRIFGCELNTILYQKPSGYTNEEKQAIKVLYDKITGQ